MTELFNKIKIFVDGADVASCRELLTKYPIKGFTTNPTLMKSAGVTDYETFAKDMLAGVNGLPVSFEVIADDHAEMKRQAMLINQWGTNVNIKIPITNTTGAPSNDLIRDLNLQGVQVNTTAVFTKEQIDSLADCFDAGTPAIVSVFSGRIADAGQDPCEYVKYAVQCFKDKPHVEVLWASTREIFNVVQAIESGCHIITVPNSLFSKLKNIGKDLTEFSRDTVKMFRDDAVSSGFKL